MSPAARKGETAFQFMLGAWDLRRKVIDHRHSQIVCFAGEATVTATAFKERGEIDQGGTKFETERSYHLRPGANSVSVLFSNDAAFIDLDLRASQEVRHLCGADVYLGRFYFRGTDEWAERWRVSGPRKNYVSLARYRRIS